MFNKHMDLIQESVDKDVRIILTSFKLFLVL
jgi:hypothetical protein